MSCAVTRIVLPDLRTLPSTTWRTLRRAAISGMPRPAFLNWKDDVRDATSRPATSTSTLRISSAMPSEKYAWSPSGERSANGSTAIDAADAAGGASTTAVPATGSPASSICCHTVIATSTNSPMTMATSSLRPVSAVTLLSSGTSSVRTTPSGVSSYAQASTSATGKPISSSATIRLSNQAGRPSVSSSVVAICASTQPTTA